jgi:hypothetical protein
MAGRPGTHPTGPQMRSCLPVRACFGDDPGLARAVITIAFVIGGSSMLACASATSRSPRPLEPRYAFAAKGIVGSAAGGRIPRRQSTRPGSATRRPSAFAAGISSALACAATVRAPRQSKPGERRPWASACRCGATAVTKRCRRCAHAQQTRARVCLAEVRFAISQREARPRPAGRRRSYSVSSWPRCCR